MSTSDEPNLKRKRGEISPEGTATPVVPTRSDIWYNDGNVVLQAQGVQFRVHKSILAESSSVFGDMFGFPQPPSANTELVEGCPVVHVSDSAQEMTYILQALCQRKYLGYGEILSIPVLSAFLCLGQKYDIQQLYLNARKRLFENYPDANVEWTAMEAVESFMEIVIIARKTGLLSILPYVLYSCCHMESAAEIIDGTRRKDGSISILPIQDRLACLAGYRAICDAQADTMYAWLHMPLGEIVTAGCKISVACKGARGNIFLQDFSPKQRIMGFPVKADYAGLCGICAAVADRKYQEGREAMWERLPALFGLPPWAELLKERAECASYLSLHRNPLINCL
ncbi:hypothetical protein FIBSPDRAFT_751663 [Athelia psychrophila]|uniref:BTB domain-containing protein n=1 Tax=Athelia psychrophila TaxID=1759441 RepID=A0A166DBZ6_9AGAM|nr:hypothetical protein FIBSPDRAFT_751663 [Fibularhizoctonia sp. CBS 109695]